MRSFSYVLYSHDVSFLSWNRKFNYDIHNVATNHILSQLHPLRTHISYAFNINFNIFRYLHLFVRSVEGRGTFIWGFHCALSVEKSINTYQSVVMANS